MRGLFSGIGLFAPRELRSPHRQAQCGACKAIREDLGGLAPILHRHDLTVLALLGPPPALPVRTTYCSALPVMRVKAAELPEPFRSRLIALGLAMAGLEARDRHADGQSPSPADRVRGWVARRLAQDAALAPLGVCQADLDLVTARIQASEVGQPALLEDHLAPVQTFASNSFQRLYEGILEPADARNLGRSYVSVLCLLDAFEDQEEDRRADRFNLWASSDEAPPHAPAARLQAHATVLGTLLLRHARASARAAVEYVLGNSLRPRVLAALERSMAGAQCP